MGLALVWETDAPAYRKVVVRGRAYYIVEEAQYVDLVERGAAAGKQIYSEAGGDPNDASEPEWEANVRTAASTSGVYTRDGAPRDVKAVLFDEDRRAVITRAPLPGTPVESDAERLARWSQTAAIFKTYEQCKQAAEAEVGATPHRADCLIESEMVEQAVTHSLVSGGIRPYPGSLQVPEGVFDQLTDSAKGIVVEMVYQRTYTPVVAGRVLSLQR